MIRMSQVSFERMSLCGWYKLYNFFNSLIFLSDSFIRCVEDTFWSTILLFILVDTVCFILYRPLFRKSMTATHLLRNKVYIMYIAQLLGCASLRTTQKYLHVEISELKKLHSLYHPQEKHPFKWNLTHSDHYFPNSKKMI